MLVNACQMGEREGEGEGKGFARGWGRVGKGEQVQKSHKHEWP